MNEFLRPKNFTGDFEMQEEPKSQAIDYWYGRVTGVQESDRSREELDRLMLKSLHAETPEMVTVTMERTCNLQCAHCLFQKEKTSREESRQANLGAIVENLVRQLPKEGEGEISPSLLHDGRILRASHLEIFRRVREARPDVKIGLIDNGTYTNLIDEFDKRDFKLDWLDISIDGTEESHDRQRDPIKKRAYRDAVHGLEHAREVTKPHAEGGRVTSLMTLTNINYADIKKVADFLFSENPASSAKNKETGDQQPYVDEFHLTTMYPALEENVPLELSTNELRESWEQLKKIIAMYPNKMILLRIYRTEDAKKLGEIVGKERFRDAFKSEETEVTKDGVVAVIDGVRIAFFPQSIWPREGLFVDADGVQRVAHSQPWTLAEHGAGKAIDGTDLRAYSVQKLNSHTDLKEAHDKVVDQWWEHFGEAALQEEIKLFSK